MTKSKKVFISHSSADYRDPATGKIITGNAISEIIKVLRDNQISIWIDETGLISSKGWCHQIEKAIDDCSIFLFVSSENANKSANTANEVQYALDSKKHIIPFKLDRSPYHKDLKLNLIRIHFIKYYEDRHKALSDLVTTIKGLKSDALVINTSVTINPIKSEKEYNGKLFSNLVLSIFTASDIKKSVFSFNQLKETLQCESDDGYKHLEEYLKRLDNIAEERNYNVRRTRIERLISDIKEKDVSSNRNVKVAITLLKMYLYFYLNDIREVNFIQAEIKDVQYELSYVERNSDTINDIANLGIRTGTFLTSAVALCMGKGGSAGKAGMFASTKGAKINVVKTSEQIKKLREKFEAFKDASLRLTFSE